MDDRWSKLFGRAPAEKSSPVAAPVPVAPQQSSPQSEPRFGANGTLIVEPKPGERPAKVPRFGATGTLIVPAEEIPEASVGAPARSAAASSTLPSQAPRRAPPPATAAVPSSVGGAPSEARPPSTRKRAALEFDMWCKRVAFGIMETMHAGALRRAEALERETGLRVEVVYPAQPPVDLMHAASEMQFMKLVLGSLEAYLYSARNPGKPPILHMLVAADQLSAGSRPVKDVRQLAKRRVASTPVCRVAVPPDGVGYLLVEPSAPTQRVREEEVMLRLFNELVRRNGRG
jgi:hypothetical protein